MQSVGCNDTYFMLFNNDFVFVFAFDFFSIILYKRIARLARAGFQSVCVTRRELQHKKLVRVVHVQLHVERVL